MYVAPSSDKDWLLSEQRKLYARSYENPDYVFRKLWVLMTDPRNLRLAFGRVARNRGRRTAGVDGFTVRSVVAKGVDAFVDEVRKELRSGAFRPSPVAGGALTLRLGPPHGLATPRRQRMQNRTRGLPAEQLDGEGKAPITAWHRRAARHVDIERALRRRVAAHNREDALMDDVGAEELMK